MITAKPLTKNDFAPFGDVIEAGRTPDRMINDGRCGRFHDLARLDFADGRAGISVFESEVIQQPVFIDLLERHPDGSQAFISMTGHPFLVVVAEDAGGVPGELQAFVTQWNQGINFHRGTWHGVLMPLHPPGLFAVVDRIGDGANLEEFRLENPVRIDLQDIEID